MDEVSRQRQWQLRMRAEGRCPKCGELRRPGETRTHCDLCNEKMNALARVRKAKLTKARREPML